MIRKLSLLSLCILSACDSSSRNAEVTIRNDIQDKEYNKIEISRIRHSGGLALNKYELSPGNEISVPFVGVTNLRVTRAYKEHSKIYEVTCPARKKKVLLKLIDIYLNKMPSGCTLSNVGESRAGNINWK